MHIRLGFDIELELAGPTTVVTVLNVHPSRQKDLLEPDKIRISPAVTAHEYIDTFGNRCSRFLAPRGSLRLTNSTLIVDSGEPDPIPYDAVQHPVAGEPVVRVPAGKRVGAVAEVAAVQFRRQSADDG